MPTLPVQSLLVSHVGKFLDDWRQPVMRSRIRPMKKIATTLRMARSS